MFNFLKKMFSGRGTGGITAGAARTAASLQGKKLGALIASLKLSPDSLDALMRILPSLSVEQLDRLTAVLGNHFAIARAGGADERLEEELRKIRRDWERADQNAAATALNELKKLEKEVTAKI